MFTVFIVVCLLKTMCMASFILIGCCMRELHGHLCPYYNVLPEAVYCCFTNCLHVCMIRVRVCYHITKFCYAILFGF